MLPLFPASSLDASILTSVLVGLLVLWFFQETLGWTFTGLVVPGYFATILLVQPVSALAVAIEAVATWGVVLALSDRVPRWWPWTPFFGRDRFYAFLLASVGVRVLFEAGGLNAFTRLTGVPIDPDVHALGLVLVPLMGHAMWRSGLAGLPRIGFPILITWAILRYVVLPYTNLSLTSFALTYEDLAGEFVASPQHYLLLLVGATFGSWANLGWGYDFGGLIVPGLLALCWLEPDRLAATVGEAIVIAWVLRAAMALPGLRTANLTGGRPLVLAYVLGYLLKWVLGWTLGGAWPGFEVRSLFGFGYLLSSLLALRIAKHGEVWRSLVPALGTSLAAVVVGQGAGWVLSTLLATPPPPAPLAPPPDPVPAMLHAAWGDAGDATGVPLQGPALVTAGDGFGGVWLRDGRPILVTATVGPVALADALFAIADLVGADAVQLCAAEGDTCARTRARLARGRTVIEVHDGDTALLELPPGGIPNLDLRAVADRAGALSVTATNGDPRIVLPPARRVSLAAAAVGQPPGPWTWPAVPAGVVPAVDTSGLRVLVEEVVAPWARWWQLADEDALRLATRRAADLGLVMRQEEERTSLEGPGWLVVLRRGAKPMLIDVPEGRTEPGAVRFALSLAKTLDAGAVVLRAAAPDPVAPRDAPTAITAALVQAFGPSVQAATVRSVAQQKDPGVDLVLARGRTLYSGETPPTPAWLGRLEALGMTLGWFDGSAQRAACTDSDNATRRIVQATGGEDAHVTVWARAAPTERLLPVDAVPVLARGGLPVRAVPWDQLLGPAPDRHALDHAGPPDRAVGCDALLGCRWIIETSCNPTCGGTVLPMAPGGSTDGDPTAMVAFSAGAVRWSAPP